MRITSEEYVEDYKDPNSKKYKEFEERFKNNVMDLPLSFFADLSGFYDNYILTVYDTLCLSIHNSTQKKRTHTSPSVNELTRFESRQDEQLSKIILHL